MASDVVVYTTRICAYCHRAKSLLTKRGIPFREVDVSNDAEARDWLVRTTGYRTVPQIFIDGTSVGGSDELHALDATGKLATMIRG
ncbi:MAG: glutaredoxin 3 [Polyangiaceae bacterium]